MKIDPIIMAVISWAAMIVIAVIILMYQRVFHPHAQVSNMSKKAASLMSLPANKRRTKLAKDVLKHLKNIIIASKGHYLTIIGNGSPYSDSDQADKIFKENKCEVCAIGALFVADVIIRDRITIGRAYDLGGGHIMKDRLKAHFGQEQLVLIESAFEKTKIGAWYSITSPKISAALRFGERYKTAKGRMVGIMNNIIKNKGEFIP